MSKKDIFKNFRANRDKMKGVNTSSEPPKYWLNTGIRILNKTISGSYMRGYASGRLSMISGPSDAGKSLLAIASAVEAQKAGYGVFIVDSEHALDNDYMEAVGLDVKDEMFLFQKVNSIANARKVMFDFIDEYRKNADDAPPFVMIVDSLDQLKTESHIDKINSGEIYHDQGLHAKQLKQFCSDWAQEIGDLNIFGIATKQPYANQNTYTNKSRPWVITESVRFPFSQIILVTNVRLRDADTREMYGIKLTALGEKTRFCKPYQRCVFEVPYDISLNEYSGIFEAAVSIGLVDRRGSWYDYNGKKFRRADLEEHIEDIFKELVAKDDDENILFEIELEEGEVEDNKS